MSTRIEIELTSALDDSTWTWRAAGAKLPKGTVDASVLPADSKVGDLLRAEAEMHMDGTEIVSVLPPKAERAEPELLEIVGSGRKEELVTSTLVSKRDRDRDRGKGRGKGRDGDRGRGKGRGRNDRGRGGERGSDGENKGRDRRPRRPSKPPLPERPKAKRLRAKRDHRTKVLAELPEEHQPIAEQVLRGGVPAVRKAIEEQNAKNKAENLPEVEASGLVKLAEDMLPKLKAAEWEDRADAALAGIDELDLRDLRSVVVAAESAARSDEALAKAEQLRTAVTARVDNEHAKWLADVDAALKDDRTVRALRMSSRPPKAGAPLPPDLAKRLSDAALAGLTTEISQDRWGTVLDALSYSPVRSTVVPPAVPENPTDELVSTVRRLSMRIPEIAALFGIEPTAAPKRERRRRGGKKKSDGGGGAAKAEKPKKDKPKAEEPKADKPKAEEPKAAEAPAEAAAEAPAEAAAEAPAEAAAEAPAEAAAEAPAEAAAEEE